MATGSSFLRKNGSCSGSTRLCVIIDACVRSEVFGNPPSSNCTPVLRWLFDQDGRIVIGGKLAENLSAMGSASRALASLSRAGKLRTIPKADLKVEEEAVIATRLCVSNDTEIIALARCSGARTLCSADQDLHTDFTNHRLLSGPRGSVYQRPGHSHLLRHTSSCRASRQ